MQQISTRAHKRQNDDLGRTIHNDMDGVYEVVSDLQAQMRGDRDPSGGIFLERFKHVKPPTFSRKSEPMVAELWVREYGNYLITSR